MMTNTLNTLWLNLIFWDMMGCGRDARPAPPRAKMAAPARPDPQKIQYCPAPPRPTPKKDSAAPSRKY